MIEPGQLSSLFLIYGGGIIALYLLIALLYVHALRRRRELELTALEIFDTKSSIGMHLLAAGIGVVSCILALTLPPQKTGMAGFAYFLFGPVFGIYGTIMAGRRRKRFGAAART